MFQHLADLDLNFHCQEQGESWPGCDDTYLWWVEACSAQFKKLFHICLVDWTFHRLFWPFGNSYFLCILYLLSKLSCAPCWPLYLLRGPSICSQLLAVISWKPLQFRNQNHLSALEACPSLLSFAFICSDHSSGFGIHRPIHCPVLPVNLPFLIGAIIYEPH